MEHRIHKIHKVLKARYMKQIKCTHYIEHGYKRLTANICDFRQCGAKAFGILALWIPSLPATPESQRPGFLEKPIPGIPPDPCNYIK